MPPIIADLIAVTLATASTIGANKAIPMLAKKTFGVDLDRYEPKGIFGWVSNPLYRCIYCMSSLWGGPMFVLWGGNINHIIPAILAVCGVLSWLYYEG